jgi:hypothetical protein
MATPQGKGEGLKPIVFEGPVEIWSHDEGRLPYRVFIDGRTLTDEIREVFKHLETEGTAYEIGKLAGRYRFTLKRIE